jgi:hypothetical protein
MSALAADRKALTVTQAAIAGQVHQTLDVHRGLATKIALNRIVTVDSFADLQNFGIGQLINPASIFDADLAYNFLSLGLTNAMNVLKRDYDALIGRYIDACNTGHALNLLVTRMSAKAVNQPTTKKA